MAIRRGLAVESGKRYESALDADGPFITTRLGLGAANYAAAGAVLTANYDFTVQPGLELEDIEVVLRKNFIGGAISAATLSFGTVADPSAFVPRVSVFAGAPGLVSGLPLTGVATLAAGTVTVLNAAVRTGSIIQVTTKVVGGTQGILSTPTITDQVSFVITSSNGADTSTVQWVILPRATKIQGQDWQFGDNTFISTTPWLPTVFRSQLIVAGANVNALTQGWADVFLALSVKSVRT